MFVDEALQKHLKTSNTIKTKSLIIAEWNMNDLSNIASYGNYRYRPYGVDAEFKEKDNNFDPLDQSNRYSGADESIILSTELFDNEGEAFVFQKIDEKRKLYFGLRQCFEPFRPRSGINKCLYFNSDSRYSSIEQNNISNAKFVDDVKSARRPRYYFCSREDNFKYWTSFRIDGLAPIETPPGFVAPTVLVPGERGVSKKNQINNQGYPIEDASPFVVYKEAVPANRIVIKMQTNIGTTDTSISTSNRPFEQINFYGTSASMRFGINDVALDPLIDINKSSIPKIWSIDYLDDNNEWKLAYQFDENDQRRDGSPIVPWDGHVEIYWGLIIPDKYKKYFHFVDYLSDEIMLPAVGQEGDSYIVGASNTSSGVLRIWSTDANEWDVVPVQYGFNISENDDTKRLGITKSLVDPDYYYDGFETKYRDIIFIKGLRVSVNTMYGAQTTFDLIEMSPRLKADVTKYVESYQINKEMYSSDMNIPVGGLVASNGSLEIFNFDNSFTETYIFNKAINKGSLVYNKLDPNVKFDIYDIVTEVKEERDNLPELLYDKIIPVKTMYAEDIPPPDSNQQISITLRDFFFRLETMRCPSMFYTNVSVTAAVAMLLDSIGFSNYVFLGVPENNTETIIPYFFVEPESSVAEVLSNLAMATQTSMYFDEYNNFVVMFKDYLIPDLGVRDVDHLFSAGSSDNSYNTFLSNIESIESQENVVVNDGVINYTTRYIQREITTLEQDSFLTPDRTFGYKPVLLWEVSGDDNVREMNEVSQQSSFGLSALALNTDLSASVPYVENHQIINNIIDVGDNIYWIYRFSGYLCANGEIIRYDAVEYDIPEVGKVFIKTGEQFQKYFSKLKFGGTMFPTGLIRIYTEPYYENEAQISPSDDIYINPLTNVFEDYTPREVLDRNSETLWPDANPNRVFAGGNFWFDESTGKYRFNTPSKILSQVNIEYWPDNAEVSQIEDYYKNISEPNSSFTALRIKNGQVKKHGRGQFDTPIVEHYAGLQSYWSPSDAGITEKKSIQYYNGTTQKFLDVVDVYARGCIMLSEKIFSSIPTENINYKTNPSDQNPTFGSLNLGIGSEKGSKKSHEIVQNSLRTGIIKNFMRRSFADTVTSAPYTPSLGHVQSSAFVFQGPFDIPTEILKRDFISYKYKYLFNDFTHFGTRMRIIGTPKRENTSAQVPINSVPYFSITGSNNDVTNIDGGSGGMGIFINEEKNHGYFLEICALTKDQLESFTIKDSSGKVTSVLHNIIFYKNVPNFYGECVPVKLWGGLTQIIVDEGNFVGEGRIALEENPTVYDLAIEYEVQGSSYVFYLYLNGEQVARVVDDEKDSLLRGPRLPKTNTMCVFVRASSKCMFENIYALKKNISQQTNFDLYKKDEGNSNLLSVFGVDNLTSQSLRKYALSSVINSTYLSGISSETTPKYDIYFEEFGTIMRECYYFDIKYDQAYPALLAVIAPIINRERGYTYSGFYAGSYGARFLIFNSTDKFLNLDDSTGNYLRIFGVTFTQNTTRTLTVDGFFNEISDFSDPFKFNDGTVLSPEVGKEQFNTIKLSRFKYGKREFSLDSPYIQSSDTARDVMYWIIKKAANGGGKRKNIEMTVFGMPHVQLGDLAQIDYTLPDGKKYIEPDKQFLIYGINYTKTFDEYSIKLRMVEV